MAYLREAEVRRASQRDGRIASKDASTILKEELARADSDEVFDVFLCHSVRDAELVQGAKHILQQRGLTVYVDWIVDPQMGRSEVTASAADVLRRRMRNSNALFYLYSLGSRRSRWMPWEIGFFDGLNGNVAILPITPDSGLLDFSQEEYQGSTRKLSYRKLAYL